MPALTRRSKVRLKNLGFRAAEHFTTQQASDFFGIFPTHFRKMLANTKVTPSPPTVYGNARTAFFRKVDIVTMAETFPYWMARRSLSRDYQGQLKRIILKKLPSAQQLPLNLTATPKAKKAPVAPSQDAAPDVLERRLAGYRLATTKYGISIAEATDLAKQGLFD